MATLEPMSWPEENIGPAPPRITTRTSSSASAAQEGVVELDEHPPVLGVAGLGPVEDDPHDAAVVDGLVADEVVVGHVGNPSPGWARLPDSADRWSPGCVCSTDDHVRFEDPIGSRLAVARRSRRSGHRRAPGRAARLAGGPHDRGAGPGARAVPWERPTSSCCGAGTWSWPTRDGPPRPGPSSTAGAPPTVSEHVAWLEEMDRARAPGPMNVIGVSNIAPAIMDLRHRRADRRGSSGPCSAATRSGPRACRSRMPGSDLASLRTRAVRRRPTTVGWSTARRPGTASATCADWCQLYVRTDPDAPKHKGISCLLVDLRTPGIEARPLRTITGDRSFAELFFTDVVVPVDALLGEEHRGLDGGHDHPGLRDGRVARLHLDVGHRSSPTSWRSRRYGTPRRPTPWPVSSVADVHSRIAAMRWLTCPTARRGADPGRPGSLAKLVVEPHRPAARELGRRPAGAGRLHGRWADNLASVRQASIAGGTTEINLNIVGESLLGLPREPS